MVQKRRDIRRRTRDLVPLLGQAYGMACALITTLILTQLLGLQVFGAFAVASTLTLMGSEITTAGYAKVISRRMPQRVMRGQPVTPLLVPVALGSLVMSLAIIVLGCTAALAAETLGWIEDATPTLLCLVAILPAGAITLGLSIHLVQKATFVAVLPGRFVRPTVMLALILLTEPSGNELLWACTAYMISFLGAGTLAAMLIWIGYLKGTIPIISLRNLWHTTWIYFAYSRKFLINSILIAVQNRLMLLSFGLIATPEQLSLYAAAERIVAPAKALYSTTRSTFRPRFAEAHATNDPAIMQRAYQSLLVQRQVLVLAPLVLLSAAPWLGPTLLGPEFTGVYPVLAILGAGAIIVLYTGPMAAVLSMTNHEGWLNPPTTLIMIVSLVAMVPLGIALGAIGAALVSTSSAIILNGLMVWKTRQTAPELRIMTPRVVILTVGFGVLGFVAALVGAKLWETI